MNDALRQAQGDKKNKMNEELYNEYKRVLEWIEEAEHYRRIKEMKPLYEMPESMKEKCLKLREMSYKLKGILR